MAIRPSPWSSGRRKRPQVPGHVGHRHRSGEIENVPGESAGVAMPARGKGHLRLLHRPACPAPESDCFQDDPDRTAPDGQPPEPSLPPALADDLAAAAPGAPELRTLRSYPEVDLTADVLGPNVGVAFEPDGVVQ